VWYWWHCRQEQTCNGPQGSQQPLNHVPSWNDGMTHIRHVVQRLNYWRLWWGIHCLFSYKKQNAYCTFSTMPISDDKISHSLIIKTLWHASMHVQINEMSSSFILSHIYIYIIHRNIKFNGSWLDNAFSFYFIVLLYIVFYLEIYLNLFFSINTFKKI
jgi:hypothetical protein